MRSETHVRLARVVASGSSSLVEKGTASEGLVAFKITLFRMIAAMFSFRLAARVIFLSAFASEARKLDIISNDDRLASGLAALTVSPDILVITAGKIDTRAVLELHLPDTLSDISKGFDIDVDPASVVLCVLVVDTLADAETDNRAVLGKLDCGLVVKAAGDNSVGCGKT